VRAAVTPAHCSGCGGETEIFMNENENESGIFKFSISAFCSAFRLFAHQVPGQDKSEEAP